MKFSERNQEEENWSSSSSLLSLFSPLVLSNSTHTQIKLASRAISWVPKMRHPFTNDRELTGTPTRKKREATSSTTIPSGKTKSCVRSHQCQSVRTATFQQFDEEPRKAYRRCHEAEISRYRSTFPVIFLLDPSVVLSTAHLGSDVHMPTKGIASSENVDL